MRTLLKGTTEHLRGIAGAVCVVVLLLVMLAPPAYAYIDPASGSFILQMLLAALFSTMFMLRRLRTKVWEMLRTLAGKKSSDEPTE
jgi:hypothetical protein